MRINLIPMAGEGQRYRQAGYSTPKPLIDVAGVPMIVRSAKALPPADRWVFVCRESHLRTVNLEEVLRSNFESVEIVALDRKTEGQAITCLMAREYIPAEAILTIGACDYDMVYDTSKVRLWLDDQATEGWIWTFRANPVVLQDPRMYGWVETAADGLAALRVSCKVPISKEPLDDHAIIGTFTFKKAQVFFDAVEAMVRADRRINGEFYVDVAADHAIRAGRRMRVFEVEHYIGWGTPQDLDLYNYWRSYFSQRGL